MPMIPVKEAMKGVAIAEPEVKEHDVDLLIVGGTSLVVYPAAGLLRYFQGDSLVLINRDATQMDKMADLCIRDAIGAVMEQIQVPEKEA